MSPELILPRESNLYEALSAAAHDRRCAFFAGLPGVGKSLLIQQTALIAAEMGRRVHLLQWDVARSAFETPEILARYPEVDGVTHAALRKAAGLWVRPAVLAWDRANADPAHLLIGEAPLVGNRLSELTQKQSDDVEALLRGDRSLFMVPAPSVKLKRAIEQARQREMDAPLHERERANASLGVIQSLWAELTEVAQHLGAVRAASADAYDRDQYVGVYERLLRHRPIRVLDITERFSVRDSPHAHDAVAGELVPTSADVAAAMARVEALPSGELERQVAHWYEV
jgi:hypothetical protein